MCQVLGGCCRDSLHCVIYISAVIECRLMSVERLIVVVCGDVVTIICDDGGCQYDMVVVVVGNAVLLR